MTPCRPRLEPVARMRLADHAHEAIRDSILAGRFRMGERLIEATLATDLGMSRAPVREALRRLTEEGLITDRAHQGAFVSELTADDVIDLYNARLGVETTAVRLFMRLRRPTGPLWARIDAMRRAADRKHAAAVTHAEFEFHRHLCEQANNPLLMGIFIEQESRLLMLLALDEAASLTTLSEVAPAHEPVVRSIESGDVWLAICAMETHILEGAEEAVRVVGEPVQVLLDPLVLQDPLGPRPSPFTLT